MGKVKELTVEENKVERVLGGDIETNTYEELDAKFQEVQKTLSEKKYSISLSQESISLLLLEILPNVKWVGQQAWDIKEAQKVIVDLKPDVVSQVPKEALRAMFQFVATNEFSGVDHVSQVASLLTVLAEVIHQQIGADEQLLRDAGFELQAAEMGITPEAAVQQAMAAQIESQK